MKSLPKWTERFLRAICPDEVVDQIIGDLIELYNNDIKSIGERSAKRALLMAVFRFARPGIVLRNRCSTAFNPIPMLKNYFLTTLRHARRSKVNFIFKVAGLSLAIFSSLAIGLYVSYQLSFDKFHDDYQNIHRVNSERKENGVVQKFGIVPLPLGPVLKREVPEIVFMTRIRYANATYLQYENRVIGCEGLIEADSSLFNVLTFDFIKGNKNALKNPNGIVLTRTMANNIFGTTDVLEKTITINLEDKVYEVTGVIEDVKQNSHLDFSAIIPITLEHDFTVKSIADPVEFVDLSAMLYVRLAKYDREDLNTKIETILERYVSKADQLESGFRVSFQRIEDVYLAPYVRHEYATKGSKVYVYAFSILGVLLLVVAGINYVNLSLADFSSRSRETGVRRVLGARKYQLMTQIFVETMMFSVISLLVGFGLLYLLFPQILRQLDPNLRLKMLLEPHALIIVATVLFALIFLSALPPARQFAAGGIDRNLRIKGGSYKSSLSQILLFAQFTISSVCIGCTFIVGEQIGFIHSKVLGFDRSNLLVLSMPWEFSVRKMQTFKQELKQLAGITAVSNSSFRVGNGYWKDWYFVEDRSGIRQIELYEVFSDDELFTTLRIEVLEGRTYNSTMPSDSGAAFVINETAARELGWTNPIGKRIYTHPEEKGKWDGIVVGVVSDINISPLYEKVLPLVMRLPWQNEYPEGFVYIRYAGDAQAVIASVETKYKALMPGYPLAVRFVDELYNSQHAKEEKVFASVRFGTLVIVAVSALGIFSMAAFISIRRMKEFGIRKVLGASVSQVASLHIGFFLRLVLIANAIALPIAYYLIREWLNTFAYRTDLTAKPFLLAGLIGILLVVVAGGYSAWRSGRANPIEVIKVE